VADLSETAAFPFVCEGGLVLNQSTFIMKPGQALELTNFEPDTEGGYRRINGFKPYVNSIVPETAVSTEPVLMSTIFSDYVIGARGTSIYRSASTTLRTKIASDDTMSGSGSLLVKDSTSFSSSGTVVINSEDFTYTGKTATTLTGVTRAANSTTAAAHAVPDVVSETWTSIDSGRTSASKYNFEKFNFDGNDKLIVVDGANAPTVFNTSLTATDVSPSSTGTGEVTTLLVAIAADTGMTGSGTITVNDTSQFASSGSLLIGGETFTYTGKTSTTFTGVTRATSSSVAAAHELGVFVSDLFPPAVLGAKFVTAFKDHMFYAGMSANKQEVIFSVPFIEDSFSVAIGAGSIKVDDTIVGLKVFRDNLFIFCENRIFKLGGSSQADFAMVPVTRKIGCINGDTIQEFAGDLIFLGPDGLRTIAGTARIGDVELGTISNNVQTLFRDNISDSASFESLVIPDKTQYRIFFSKSGGGEKSTIGVICVMKGQTFEFSKLKGIRPACTDTIISEGDVKPIHGGFDGYIYRQDQGNTFNGELIQGKYRSPDLTMNDPGIRKHMQRVNINYAPESTIDADMFVRYDYESAESTRPAAYPLDSLNVAGIYGSVVYGVASYGGPTQPIVRKAVEGSGFAVAIRIEDGSNSTAPYSLKGFQMEYQLGARR
tara:strand:- start:834 stop:2810 length:1977 start_codon:yes stop_codon:yes gene_type:complete